MNNKVAVIILNWNGANLLKRYLPSVIRNTNAEIGDVIVADNGSTDDSVKVLKKEFPEVKLLLFTKNYGFAEGYNKAISETNYKYTVLLNSDVEVPEKWLEPLYEYCEANETVGACQPKIMADNNHEMFEYAGAAGGYIDKHGYPYCRGRIFADIEKDNGQYDTVADVLWASGAALFVRTDIYIKAGGLDAKFFAHMEEIDLCWRINLMGYGVKAIPASKVYHLGGGSLPADNPRKTYLNFRNNLLLLRKNLPEDDGKRILFIRRLYDTLAFFMFLAKFDFANARAVLKAHNDYRKMKSMYNKYPSVNLLSSLETSKQNIITGYYLKGKKKFTDYSIK